MEQRPVVAGAAGNGSLPQTSANPAPALVWRVLPWAAALGALVAALLWTQTPAADISRYAAYWALAVLLPGTLMHRALRGSRGNLPEDLAFGAATGLVLELLAWALAAVTGAQDWLWVWPLPVVAAFAVVPRLRRHWRVGRSQPVPLIWAWGTAAALGAAVFWLLGWWTRTPLPPATATVYQDLYYHLGLVGELTRDAPFQLPQVAGEPLRYHYLSNAHMAAASLISSVPAPTVLLRLWLGPVVFTFVLLAAALARQITGRWWAAALAAAAVIFAQPLAFGGYGALIWTTSVSFLSPSQSYLLIPLLALAGLLITVLRGEQLGAAWVLIPGFAFACAGAKASGLPLLLAGATAALIVARGARLRVLAALLLMVSATVAGSVLFVGGGAGTLTVQPLSPLSWALPWSSIFEVTASASSGHLPPGLAGADAVTWGYALGIVCWWLLLQVPCWVGLAAVFRPRLRRDPVAWLLGGALVAGAGAMFLVAHPSASQGYFMQAAMPFGMLLAVALLADVTPSQARWVGVVLAGWFAAGFLLAVALRASYTGPTRGRSFTGWAVALAQPLGRAALIAALLVAAWWLLRRRTRHPPLPGVAAALAVLLGASFAGGIRDAWTQVHLSLHDPVLSPRTANAITTQEMRAAQWLAANAPKDALVATNVHCTPIRTRPDCDSRAFWVSALTGRRTFVESWGYSDPAVAAHGRNGLSYVRQQPPDPGRFALNERVFTAPTEADLHRLRDHGVTWLFADTRAGPVSPDLAELTTIRHSSGPVTIHQLR